jgi:undecaprenyl-diphosphatase
VILGLVEGLTEFIPVSSTGHLILSGHFLGFTGDRAAAFEIFIQLGAVLAVVWESRRSIMGFASDMGRRGTGRRALFNLALGFLPSAVIGLAIHDVIARVLFAPVYVCWGLLAGGVGILVVEGIGPRVRVSQVAAIPWRMALGVGFAQCLSLFPGVSRSAATILGGMTIGIGRRAATEFSFLLAIPTMLAASLYELYRWRDLLGVGDIPGFALGFAMAFVSGLVAVRFLLRYVATHDFKPFAYYRIVLGIAALWILWGL